MATDVSVRFGVDGEKEFRSALSGINSQIKNLDSEMKLVVSSMSGMSSAEEKAAAKNNVLSRSIEAQKTKISVLSDEYSRQKDKLSTLSGTLEGVKEAYGENSKEALTAERAYNKQAKTVNDLGTQLNKAKTDLASMESQMNATADAAEETGDSFAEAGNGALAFGDVLKANVLSSAIVSGVKALANAVKSMAGEFIESAANVKAETAQFEQTFGDMGDTATAAIDRVASSSGILDTRLNTLGSSIYAFARSSGGSTTESMELMETALQATADAAAYYDRSLEDTADSLTSFLKGNYANDAALGVSCTETTRNAKATALFGQEFSKLTEIQKQQTLLAMVTDSQKLSGAMGQAAREADGWENVQGNLNEAWRQFKANVGTPFLENLIPIVQNVTEKMQTLTESIDWDAFGEKVGAAFSTLESYAGAAFEKAKEIAENIDWQSVGEMISTAFSVAGDVVSALVDKFNEIVSGIDWVALQDTFSSLFQWFIENGDWLIGIIAGIAGGLLAWNVATMIQGLVSSFGSWSSAIGSAKTAFEALNKVMAANKMTIIITLVAGIITALITLWNTNEDFRNAVISIWENIKNAFITAYNAITGAWASITTFFSEKWTAIKNVFANAPATFKQIGTNIVNGIKNGITNAWSNLVSTVKNKISGLVSNIKGLLGIHSPSKVMRDEVGKMITAGLAEGIEDGMTEVQKTAQDLNDMILAEEEKLQEQINAIQTAGADDSVKAEKEALEERLSVIQDFRKEYESELQAIEKSQESMVDKLTDYGDLFTTVKDTGAIELGDLQSEIDAITAYGDALESLKARGADESLLDEIVGLGVDDATAYTNKLLEMTDDEYNQYLTLWRTKQEAAARVAEQFYKTEFDALRDEFVDKIPDELSGVKDQMQAIGENSIQGIVDGMTEKSGVLYDAAQSIIGEAVDAMRAAADIHSPSKKTASLVGVPMGEGVAVGFERALQNTKAAFSAAVMSPINRISADDINNAAAATVNGMAATGTAATMQTINIPINLNGKTIAEVIFDPLKNVAKQRGVALG